MHRAAITGDGVEILVLSGHRDAKRHSRRGGARADNQKMLNRSRADDNGGRGAAERIDGRVRRRNCLAAGGFEGRRKLAHAVGQSAIGGQHGRAIGAAEMDRATITGRDIVERIQGRHHHAEWPFYDGGARD